MVFCVVLWVFSSFLRFFFNGDDTRLNVMGVFVVYLPGKGLFGCLVMTICEQFTNKRKRRGVPPDR